MSTSALGHCWHVDVIRNVAPMNDRRLAPLRVFQVHKDPEGWAMGAISQ